MKFTIILFLFSSLIWVLPAYSKSIIQRTLASRSASMNVNNVSQLSYRRPYIHQDADKGLSGELQFQYQSDMLDKTHPFSGYTARFKAGWQGNVVDKLDWGFRLASGGWVENMALMSIGKTRQQALGGFGGNPIWLDTFHVTYNLKEDLSIRLGKMDNPYFDKGRYNVIWDKDLTPTGLNVQYRAEVTDRYTFDVNGSAFLMSPLSSWTADGAANPSNKSEEYGLNRYMLAASTRFSMIFADYDFITQLSFYNIDAKHMELDVSHVDRSLDVISNAVVDSSSDILRHKHDYSIVDISLQMRIKNFWKPVSASIQLVQNFMADDSSQEFGMVAGMILGEMDRAHAWNVGYHFFSLNRDVTLASFTDSDIGGIGTSFTGHHAMANYFINKSVELGAKYILRHDDFTGGKTNHMLFGTLTVKI